MNINRIENTNFNGLYKVPYTEKNMEALKNFVIPTYMNISKEPVIVFTGNNPFKVGLVKLMELIAKKNNSNVDWLKMNAQNHGVDVSGADCDIINIVSTRKDIDKLQKYMVSRINSRKPSLAEKIQNFFGIRAVPDYDTNLPVHLAILSEGLRLDKEEAEAFAEYSKNIKLYKDSKDVFKALMSEH